MADFLSGIFDRAGDLVDSITGKTDSKNLQAQLAQQEELNDKLIALQQQEIAYKQTPAYLKARQTRIYIACGVMLFAIAAAVFLLYKDRN